MIVKDIKLKNFRNYENEKFEFHDKLNIIYGNNAQGKTNILEGIYMFSLGKSNRASRDFEIIKFGEDCAEISMNFISKQNDSFGEIKMEKGKKKKIFINEIPISKNSDLVGRFNVVFFGPEYLSLIREGPKKRRKNIDVMISQLKIGYVAALSDYKRLIEQKNNLLKEDYIDKILLDVINEKIIDLSAYIIKIRYEYIKKIENLAQKIQLDISEGKEKLEMKYISCNLNVDEKIVKDIKAILIEKSKDIFERELKYRESILGPHRDDIEFKINEKDLKLFGSQGQQKTAVLVQKIAEVELFYEEIGEYPVLLLDDIMSELDSIRQDYVINKLQNMQIFITCTDREKFINMESGKFFRIEKGCMKECTCI